MALLLQHRLPLLLRLLGPHLRSRVPAQQYHRTQVLLKLLDRHVGVMAHKLASANGPRLSLGLWRRVRSFYLECGFGSPAARLHQLPLVQDPDADVLVDGV